MNPIKEKSITDFTAAHELINYRVMADGTLERREGSDLSISLSKAPRGSIVYDDTVYVVCDKMLYSCYDGTPGYIGRLKNCTFADDSEQVFVFEYGAMLHFIGGGCHYIYDVANDSFYEDTGHIPLLRYTDEDTGEKIMHEPFNRVCSAAREKMLVSEENYYLYGIIDTVTEVLVDDQPFTYYKVVTSGQTSYITITEPALIKNKKEIVVTYTLSSENNPLMNDVIFRNKRGFVYKTEEGVRLFLYDPDDPLGTVYYSEPSYTVDGERISTFNYFTDFSFFNVGDGASPLYSIANLSDHVLLFSDSVTYQLREETGQKLLGITTSLFSVKEITNERGISKNSGTVLYDDSLYVICPFGLYRYRYNQFTYDFISTNIEIPKSVAADRQRYKDMTLFLYRKNDELWLCCDDSIAVYNFRHKKWYRFTGIFSQRLFSLPRSYGYFRENELYMFSEDTDVDGETPFTAVCETEWYSPDTPFSCKTLYTFGAAFDNKRGAELKCTVKDDRGSSFEIVFSPDKNVDVSPYVARTHARLSRSGHFIFRLESVSGKPAANIRGIFIRYRNQGGRQ